MLHLQDEVPTAEHRKESDDDEKIEESNNVEKDNIASEMEMALKRLQSSEEFNNTAIEVIDILFNDDFNNGNTNNDMNPTPGNSGDANENEMGGLQNYMECKQIAYECVDEDVNDNVNDGNINLNPRPDRSSDASDDEIGLALEDLQNLEEFSHNASETWIEDLFDYHLTNDNMMNGDMNNDMNPTPERISNTSEDTITELERFVYNYEACPIIPEGKIVYHNETPDTERQSEQEPQAIMERQNAIDSRTNDTDEYGEQGFGDPDMETVMQTNHDDGDPEREMVMQGNHDHQAANYPNFGFYIYDPKSAWNSLVEIARENGITVEGEEDKIAGGPNMQEISAGPNMQEISADPNMQEISAGPNMQEISAGPNMQEISAGPNMETLQVTHDDIQAADDLNTELDDHRGVHDDPGNALDDPGSALDNFGNAKVVTLLLTGDDIQLVGPNDTRAWDSLLKIPAENEEIGEFILEIAVERVENITGNEDNDEWNSLLEINTEHGIDVGCKVNNDDVE